MLRVIDVTGNGTTRIENRIGESAANPYLYLSSQILSGLDGIESEAVPPLPVEEPYSSDAEQLPRSLLDALSAFRDSDFTARRLVISLSTIWSPSNKLQLIAPSPKLPIGNTANTSKFSDVVSSGLS